MMTFIRHSIGQIKCEIVGHDISLEQENILFNAGNGMRYDYCDRCNAYLLLEVNPNSKDEYFVSER